MVNLTLWTSYLTQNFDIILCLIYSSHLPLFFRVSRVSHYLISWSVEPMLQKRGLDQIHQKLSKDEEAAFSNRGIR